MELGGSLWIGPGSHPKARSSVLESRRGQGRGGSEETLYGLTQGLELRMSGWIRQVRGSQDLFPGRIQAAR